RDLSVKTATKKEILNGSVCAPVTPPPPPIEELQSGNYRDSAGYFCNQQIRVHYEDNVLKTVELQFCSDPWFTLTCESTICTGGKTQFDPYHFQVEPQSTTSYVFRRFNNDRFDKESTMTKY